MTNSAHPDDCFHPAATDNPWWTETCWFTFTAPQRRLSGQLYPFFRPNQGVYSAAVYLWDESGSQPWNIVYGKNFWHLPLAKDADLSDIELANGIKYRCVEPLNKYELYYLDPDCQEVEIKLTFTGVCPPNRLMDSHIDQPGHYAGTIRLGEEIVEVDSYGFRDRSWGSRDQFGDELSHSGAKRGGYSYATRDESNSFHAITMAFQPDECIVIHGHYMKDGEYAKLTSGVRTVLARDADGCPCHVLLEAEDELGRRLRAEGRMHNKLGVHLNPNLFTWNCLTQWQWEAEQAWGEDHDNWSATAARQFFRRYRER